MAAPAVPIDVDAGTGAWTTDGMAMIYMPRHFFVGNHQAVETALGAARHAELLHEAGHAAAFTWCEEAARAGRAEFAEHLGSIRDLVVDSEVDAGYDRRPNDELNDWMKHRFGKTKKRIPTSRMT